MNSANDKFSTQSPASATEVSTAAAKPRLVVIGGSGFIGTRLISLLRAEGTYDVRNVDIADSATHPDITTKGDVRRFFDMLHAVQDAHIVVLLAAQHRDDVRPLSRYAETNVEGMRNVLRAMSQHGVRRLIFFSSVAVYGLGKPNVDESATPDPANEYGRTKWKAEQLLVQWQSHHAYRQAIVVRPTVVFGEGNRVNVYNLLSQIQQRHFLMVGQGTNSKSMAYVGNVVAFVHHLLQRDATGYQVYNYADKPDYNTNDLVKLVSETLDKHIPSTHFPLWLGMMGGYCFDILSQLTRHRFAISAARVKKFCATTQFASDKAMATGFIPPYPIEQALRQTLRYEFEASAAAE